ncbi:MAG: polyphosphate kinase, partial [Gammaproteobacteria bacterium]|nr:polyphosphate kinase [Gammaproteobacteria bacterium]
MDTPNYRLPEYFINRELSALEFNRRVLYQAKDASTPLLERLKFLCIVSTNLDEFFEIRVSGLRQRLELALPPQGPDMLGAGQVLAEISQRTHELVDEQYRLLNEDLIPALETEGVRFIRRTRWRPAHCEWLRSYFHREIEPVLSPTSLDPARPFPKILNKSLNFIVGLRGIDAFGRPVQRAIVQAPRSLPRLIRLDPSLPETGPNDFVFLSSVIHAFLDELFTGMEILGCYQFRVTRNSDLYVETEEVDDLLEAVEGQLIAARYGEAVRLEVAHDCPKEHVDYLLEMFELSDVDLYRVDGPVNLNRLMAVHQLAGRDDLRDTPFTPGQQKAVLAANDLVAAMADRDILLHHPYESYGPVIDFIGRAAEDPDVLAIKITLYRTGPASPIADALVQAAQAGKEVT